MAGSLREVAEPRVFLPHGQLIVMGEAKAGKSSVVRALTDGKSGETTRRSRPNMATRTPTVHALLVNDQWQPIRFKDLVLGNFNRECWRVFAAHLFFWPFFMEMIHCNDLVKYKRLEDLLFGQFPDNAWYDCLVCGHPKHEKVLTMTSIIFARLPTVCFLILSWCLFGSGCWSGFLPLILGLTSELVVKQHCFQKKRIEMCSFLLTGLIFGSLIVRCTRTFLANVIILNQETFNFFKSSGFLELLEYSSYFSVFVAIFLYYQFCLKTEAAIEKWSVVFLSWHPKVDFLLDMLHIKSELYVLLYATACTIIYGFAFYTEEISSNFAFVVIFALLCFHYKKLCLEPAVVQENLKMLLAAEALAAFMFFIGCFIFVVPDVCIHVGIFLLVLVDFRIHLYGRWLQVKGYFGTKPIAKYFRIIWKFIKFLFQETYFRVCICFYVFISIVSFLLDNTWYGPEVSIQFRMVIYVLIIWVSLFRICHMLLYLTISGKLHLVFLFFELVHSICYFIDCINDSQEMLTIRLAHVWQWEHGQIIYNLYGIHKLSVIDVAMNITTVWHQAGPALMDGAAEGILDNDIQAFNEVRRQEIFKREYTREVSEAFASLKLQITDLPGDPEYYHQVFVSKDSLCMYMIVFDLSKMVEDNFRNAKSMICKIALLLQSIYARISNKSPAFLVGTHCDGISQNSRERVDRMFQESEAWLALRDWVVVKDVDAEKLCYYPVDTVTQEGFCCQHRIILKELIKNARKVADLTIPLSRVIIQDSILQLRTVFNLGSMKLRILNKIVKSALGEITPDVLEYLQQKGLLIYAKSSEVVWVSIQPQTVMDIFLCIINNPATTVQRRGTYYGAKLLKEQGLLTKDLLSCILSHFRENVTAMTRILEEYELICPFKLSENSSAQQTNDTQNHEGLHDESKEETHFVPALLPQPECSIWEESPGDQRLYVASHRFLPKQLFYRFMSLAYNRSCRYSADNRPHLYQDEGMFWLSPQQPYRAKVLQEEGLIEITFCSTAHLPNREGGLLSSDVLSAIGSMMDNICVKDFSHLEFYCGPACPAQDCKGIQQSRRGQWYSRRRHVFNVYPRCKTPPIDQVSLFCGNHNYKEELNHWLPY